MKGKKLAIITCCLIDWGGSEELWARSIPILQQEGIKHITIFKNRINIDHPEFAKLKHKNITFKELDPQHPFVKKITYKIVNSIYRLYDKIGLVTYNWHKPASKLYKQLKKNPPDLALISQGINFDGLVFAYQCLKLNIPYVIVSHKAVDFFWPQPGDRSYMKETLVKARKCLFVSDRNKELTEEQFGIRLQNSGIVINPVKNIAGPQPFPSISQGYNLACIGRLFVIDKGQDMLLRILSQPKWKERNLIISFIGEGPDLDGLKDMANLLEIKNICFKGHVDNLKDIWASHHGLILPSRSEGLPLTITEAMFFGRIVIATNAGGNSEIVQDTITGFIGEQNEVDFDKTLELAWLKRDEWQNMGVAAARYINELIPKSPEKLFVETISKILNE